MNLRRISFSWLTVFLMLALLTGCWDRTEMDELAFVMASGIDLADDGQVEVTLQIALPTGIPSSLTTGGKAKKPVLVVSAKGKDGMEALGKLQQQLSRRINLGHRGVFVFGEKYARNGIVEAVDTLLRSSESRFNSFILTSSGTTAKEILNSPYQLESIPSIGISNMQDNDFSFSVKTDKFIEMSASLEVSAVTGAIRTINKKTDSETFMIDKSAVYRKNKLVGFLSGKELKAFRLFKGNFNGMRFTVQMEPPKESYKGTVAIQLLQAKTKIRTRIRNGMPEIAVALKATAQIMANDTPTDFNKETNLHSLEKKFSEEMQKEMTSMISRTQNKFKADIVGFGREIHIEHPYFWKKAKSVWADLYTKVPVSVKVDITIERIGRTQAHPNVQAK
ncbi:Ger(x)C family spore germination protein [Paenibacillus harenae]|uniref:Ger(x)C family spore germination protein n=1 Tax=Paenibacillus harenae TaxID=306543 RepID=UPI0027904C8E|nr:Ger(x)C family spore germination protein [Paenibacillus harenae]MDQ0062592.1 spore germination protein KC [Paenibacillus harenae]